MHLKCHPSLTDQPSEFLCKHKTHLPHTQLFELHWPTQKTDNCRGKELLIYYNMALFLSSILWRTTFFVCFNKSQTIKTTTHFSKKREVWWADGKMPPLGSCWQGRNGPWHLLVKMQVCDQPTLLCCLLTALSPSCCALTFFNRVPWMSFNIFI